MNQKILVVRRDNIGDLICTLPLIASLRRLYPSGRIDVLVNSYSAAVLAQNLDISNVFVYTKAKHKGSNESVLGVYWRRLLMTLSLRRQHYDWVVLANVSCLPRTLRWARQIKGRRTVGFITPESDGGGLLTDPVLLRRASQTHEVEYVMQLLQPFYRQLTIAEPNSVPTPKVYPSATHKLSVQKELPAIFLRQKKPRIGLNISARKTSQQWSSANFIMLIKMLTPHYNCLLYWSPGASDASGHPGDDQKAQEILDACASESLTGVPTATLDELIAALDMQDIFITADGGAMHLGAALGKPVVALFGDSDPEQWRPWGVPQRIIHPASRDVRDISPDTVFTQLKSLIEELDHA